MRVSTCPHLATGPTSAGGSWDRGLQGEAWRRRGQDARRRLVALFAWPGAGLVGRMGDGSDGGREWDWLGGRAIVISGRRKLG